MNKSRLFFGYLSVFLTITMLLFNGAILYGSFDPAHPVLMFMFLSTLTAITATTSILCLERHMNTDFV